MCSSDLAERSKTLSSRRLYREPMLAALPASRKVRTKRVRIADLANEPFVLYHRDGASGLFDTIVGMCNDAGFPPRVEYEADRVQTVLSLVEAEEGVSIVPASVTNLWSNGVRFYRLEPDDVRMELVVAWKKDRPSAVVRSFLDLVNANASQIQKKAERA